MHGSLVNDIYKVVNTLEEHIMEVFSETPVTIQDFTKNLATRSFNKKDEKLPLKPPRPAQTSVSKKSSNLELAFNIHKPPPLHRQNSIFYEPLKTISRFNSPALKHVASLVEPDIINLIQIQRLNGMVHGQSFYKVDKNNPQQRNQFIFCKLSPSHRILHYKDMSDCTSIDKTNLFAKKDMIPVSNIVKIETAHDMLRNSGIMPPGVDIFTWMGRLPEFVNIYEMGISIYFKNPEENSGKNSILNLVALNKKIFDCWYDGINCLMNHEMKSDKFKEEFKTIQDLEVRMNFIQVDKKDTTTNFPRVPPPPTNYNFCGKYEFTKN